MVNQVGSNTSAQLIRLPDVLKIIPVGKSTWWAGVKAGKYPKPRKLGPKITCWLKSEIEALAVQGLASPS